jgi:hypothetical protein
MIIQRGKEVEITSVATEENFPQVDKAIDGFFQWRQFSCFSAVFMFHLAVVFEKGDIVGGGFDAQHPAMLKNCWRKLPG